jgi:hypothetical protein
MIPFAEALELTDYASIANPHALRHKVFCFKKYYLKHISTTPNTVQLANDFLLFYASATSPKVKQQNETKMTLTTSMIITQEQLLTKLTSPSLHDADLSFPSSPYAVSLSTRGVMAKEEQFVFHHHIQPYLFDCLLSLASYGLLLLLLLLLVVVVVVVAVVVVALVFIFIVVYCCFCSLLFFN